MKAHIESHLENMGASKTNGNTNASQKTRNQFEKLTRSIQTGEVAKHITTPMHQQKHEDNSKKDANTSAWQKHRNNQKNMKKYIQKIGELAKHMKSRTHLENKE